MEKIKSIHDYTGLCAPSILQEAIAMYLEQEDFGRIYIAKLRDKLKASFNLLSGELMKMEFKIPVIEGGYFIWAKLPDQFSDGFKFAVDLFEQEKVAVIPGIHFSEKAKDFIRFNIAHEIDIIEKALAHIKKFVQNA